MNILAPTKTSAYTPTGLLRTILYFGYNPSQRNKPVAKESMPSYTGNLFDYLTSGNEDQQSQLNQLWRYLVSSFPGPDLENLDRFPMHTFIMDDGTISVEWHFRNMNIAFDIEPDPEESGWSLVSTREAGLYSMGGYLHDSASIENAVKQINTVLRQQWGNVSYAR